MESTTQQNPHIEVHGAKWLRRAGIAGFFFFLLKGMVWLVAAVWLMV